MDGLLAQHNKPALSRVARQPSKNSVGCPIEQVLSAGLWPMPTLIELDVALG